MEIIILTVQGSCRGNMNSFVHRESNIQMLSTTISMLETEPGVHHHASLVQYFIATSGAGTIKLCLVNFSVTIETVERTNWNYR